MLETYNAGAGSLTEFIERGDFFRLMESEGECTVYFYRAGRELFRSERVTGGYAEQFREEFDAIKIYTATAQELKFAMRLGNIVSYDAPPVGRVTLENMAGAYSQAAAEVTNASGQLLAANASRRYLLVQNNHATADLYVNLAGAAATTAAGVKIPAGGSLELAGYVPTAAITAIGSVASNTAVVVVEG